ncbi:MAG: chemotaxis protein CheW [Gammaproteobacteria bacterium SHHR-1]|uniref:chemotaxis protein CheW n=1 Tax=Magnetovirga frankeli TaxID=947516 RepID=UPI001293CFF7|nr:chemotaxis protein CheW [gamma proteobacterium SS-5]
MAATTASQADTPLQLLARLEARSHNETKGLPDGRDSSLYWEGFAFQVAGQQLLASMDEISEILIQVPPVTRVPGAKPWVRGVVNFRGNLLPLMDLQQLMGGKPLGIDRHTRILVVNREGVSSGLLVAGVAGRKRFPRSELAAAEILDPGLAPLIEGAAWIDGEQWPIFSLARLHAYPDYHSAAR